MSQHLVDAPRVRKNAVRAEHTVTSVAIPSDSRVRVAYATTNLADAYETRLPEGAITDPETLASFIFGSRPRWVSKLMGLRDSIVRAFGLKTADGLQKSSDRRIGLFRIYEKTSTEIVMGEDDSHLDFRVSVLSRSEPCAGGSADFVIVSTVVHCHNFLGRSYIFLIAPFHRLVVKAGLRRAASLGWPLQVVDRPPSDLRVSK